jgi:hypothetical protein
VAGVEDFSKASGPVPERTKSPVDAGVLPPIVKQPGREAGNVTSNCAKVKDAWRYALSFIRIHCMLRHLVQGQDLCLLCDLGQLREYSDWLRA